MIGGKKSIYSALNLPDPEKPCDQLNQTDTLKLLKFKELEKGDLAAFQLYVLKSMDKR